jgi:hypothetical protein
VIHQSVLVVPAVCMAENGMTLTRHVLVFSKDTDLHSASQDQVFGLVVFEPGMPLVGC